eukprot:TRINITY_DN32217_c0_g1_i1.p1 TRINITY_DN32217_c0_g1~~TRINITY_DN32217_c0_g1_i1.p1  ORF type:complete len:473 (-),score=144.53 TRINITY_DN32217_c0_g1_i1:46-1464(-)
MAGDKDFDEFLEIRRHIKRLQAGTPLLLRKVLANGQEDLQICTFLVTQDLQTLRWREQEGTGESHDVPIANIVAIEDESTGVDDSDEDHHYALTLQVRSKSGRGGAGVTRLGLICSSVEDLLSWRDGLRFLVAEPEPTRRAEPASRNDQDLRRQLQLQEELCERLQQENAMLREIVTRKDAIISEMQKSERCNKTESSSRESDEHLHDREVAILRRKNRKLQNELKGKQKTIKELLDMVGRLSQQQGAESSAQEEEATAMIAGTAAARVDEDDDEDEDADDSLQALISMRSGGAKASGAGTPSGSTKASSAGMPSGGVKAASAAMLSGSRTAAGATSGPALEPKARANGIEIAETADESEETELFQEEMQALHQKLELLERAAAAATQGMHGRFQPPARTGGGGHSLPTPTISKAAAQNGTTAFSAKSQSALEALAREMSLLEEKKRMVEHLARTLEPGGADEDEDDGFPLR